MVIALIVNHICIKEFVVIILTKIYIKASLMSKSGSNGRAARSRGLHDQCQRADERGDPIPGKIKCSHAQA